MALTKIGKEGITGVSNASNATFLTATSAEGVTLAGTLAVTGVHTVGTNAVATSDGGATTTSIVQGLLKQWSSFGQNSTPFGANTAGDTFNTSSQSDESTAVVVVNLSSNMGNTTYSGFNSPHHDRGNGNRNYPKMGGQCVQTTSSYKAVAAHSNGAVDDCTMSSGIAGDLA